MYVKSDNTSAIVTLWNGSASNQHEDFHLFCANLLELPALFTGSVKICWSCVLTCFPLGSSCSENASSWLVRKGEEPVLHRPLLCSCHASDPAGAPPALFSLSFLKQSVHSYWPHVPAPDPATE